MKKTNSPKRLMNRAEKAIAGYLITLHAAICVFSLLAITAAGVFAEDGNKKQKVFIENKGQFEENKNQWDSRVLYKTDVKGARVFLEKDRFTYVIYRLSDLKNQHEHLNTVHHSDKGDQPVPCYAFRVKFTGADSKVAASGEQKQTAHHNYYFGNDPSKWASNVGIYSQVVYKELYPGIDLNVYGKEGNLKYDFIIAPSAKPEIIKQEYEGVSGISVINGSLVVKTSITDITELQPYSYQWIKGNKKQVACNYVITGNTVSFNFPQGYNKALPLIIDPVVVVATYSGTSAASETYGFCAAYDGAGNIYTAGLSWGPGYPVTNGTVFSGMSDIAVSKLNPGGSSLIYATYLGNNGSTTPQSLFVNNNNQLYILGNTDASGYPVTAGCYDNSYNGGEDIIITKLNTSGNIIASTYIGGTGDDGITYFGVGRGEIIADANDNPYVVSTTTSSNFPMVNSYDNSYNGGISGGDAVVFKMNSSLSLLTWSTYLGGTDDDAGSGIRLSCNGNVYVVGTTSSTNFPVTAGAYKTLFGTAQEDGFVSCLSNNGSVLSASTFFVGLIDFIDMDPGDSVYITGTPALDQSYNQIAVPATAGVYSNPGSANFITKMNTSLTAVIYSTVFGDGTLFDEFTPTAFMVDNCQNVYFSGFGSIGPLTANALDITDAGDFYMLKLKKNAVSLLYGSYNGGDHAHAMSRFDKKGNLYQAVCDDGFVGFTTTANAVFPTLLSGGYDLGVFKIDFQSVDTCLACGSIQPPPVATFTSSDTTFCTETGKCISFTDHSTGNPTSWKWLFPGATPDSSSQQNPTNICYYVTGTYPVTLIVTNSSGTDTVKISPMITYSNPPPIPVVTLKGDTLKSSHACSYQWFLNGAPIAGATDSFYVAKQNGTYSVQISDCMGCNLYSNGVVYVGIDELKNELQIIIHPNPVTSSFILQINRQLKNAEVVIYDMVGKEIMREKLTGDRMKIEKGSLASGVYFVKVRDEQMQWVTKMVVN